MHQKKTNFGQSPDLLGDFASPSSPSPKTNNGASIFDLDVPTNGGSYNVSSPHDFFGASTHAPQSTGGDQLNIFADPPMITAKSNNFFDDFDTLQPTSSPSTPLQASTPLQTPLQAKATPSNTSSDLFAMFGVPNNNAPATSGSSSSNPTVVVSDSVHPSFYNDHEEDKAKTKVVDKRPKEATDEKSVQMRIDEKISEIRTRDNEKEWESEARRELDSRLTARIENWAGGRKGNLRSLISTLHLVLWEGSSWKEVSMALLVDPNKLKLGYRKALLIVHPDKQVDKPLEQRFIAERVFELLTEAYKNEESIH